MRVWTKRAISASLLILLLSMGTPTAAHAAAQAAPPNVVPTAACGSSQISGTSGTVAQLRGHQEPPPTPTAYDEQLGMTFTQSFSSLEYNVTAVAQTDPVLETGPGYLLNGLANTGYWYQVGLSWNWSPGQTPGSGFDMNYEVFDTSQNSIFPTGGGGGVLAFSGNVDQGDTVALNLYFSSSGEVVMAARDLVTGSTASETYGAFGGTCFVGSPSGPANSNGYFTGLMTEWYHGDPFYANGKQVVYTDSAFGLSSAWMWMDEFNANSLQALFSEQTELTYSTPAKLQEFSFNGTNLYSDAYEFITGNLSSSAPPTTFPLTFSYSVSGGATGSTPPTLTYFSNGIELTAALNATAVTYNLDQGTTWSVSATLAGSSASARWETDQATTGVASSAQAIALVYYHQFLVSFSFSVSGGGTGYTAPSVTYESFGSPQVLGGSTTQLPQGSVWADAGSKYSFTGPLPGSSAGERWNSADTTGSVNTSGPVSATYFNQYPVTVDVSFANSGILPSVELRSTSMGSPFIGTVIQGTNSFWLDSNSSYSLPQSISLSQGERWGTEATTSGTVSGQLSITLTYQYQYYVSVESNSTAGGSTSGTSGWYTPGTTLELTATAVSGWQFEGWSGSGTAAASSADSSISLLVSGPANETATFYPGVRVTATGPVSVSYQDGSGSGSVPGGTSVEVYVPQSSSLSLKASSAPFLYSFTGWSGAASSTGTGVSLVVDGPESVTASSSYNYTEIAVILLAAIVIAIVALLAFRRPKGPTAAV